MLKKTFSQAMVGAVALSGVAAHAGNTFVNTYLGAEVPVSTKRENATVLETVKEKQWGGNFVIGSEINPIKTNGINTSIEWFGNYLFEKKVSQGNTETNKNPEESTQASITRTVHNRALTGLATKFTYPASEKIDLSASVGFSAFWSDFAVKKFHTQLNAAKFAPVIGVHFDYEVDQGLYVGLSHRHAFLNTGNAISNKAISAVKPLGVTQITARYNFL